MASASKLDLRQQVGQLLIMGFDGTATGDRLGTMLRSLQPGGIILFKRNIENAPQVHALLAGAQKFVAQPMFRCVDMEGGTVDRLRDAIAPVPSVADIAAAGSSKLARRHGRLIGEEVRALGFNTAFAPVLDLGFAPSRSVLTSRTVSDDPKKTTAYAREFLRGLDDERVLGSGQAFSRPRRSQSRFASRVAGHRQEVEALWKQDLLPYRELRKRLPFVMVAHAAYPDVTGDKTPASLSRRWMHDILRRKIGYRGLVITDDLDMGGVLAAASIEDAAIATLRAGADMFLVCQKEESVRRAFEAVLHEAERDKKFAALVAERADRVLRTKQKSPAFRAKQLTSPSEKQIAKLKRKIADFSEEVAQRSRKSREASA